MPQRDTCIAIQQAITQALNATQVHKRSYQQAITSALNATQGHKHSYKTSYNCGSKCHTGTQA